MLLTSQEDDQDIDQPIAGRKAYFTVSDISKAFLYFRPHIQRRQAQFLREDEKNIIRKHWKVEPLFVFWFSDVPNDMAYFRQSGAWKKAACSLKKR